MSPARTGVEEGAEQRPSHRSIEHGNPAIFKPGWRALDDLNIDLISASMIFAASIAAFLTHFPATLVFFCRCRVILPLRLIFPRPKPQGTVLITGASSGIGAESSYIFAERRHDLILAGRNEDQLEAVKKKVKDKYGKTAHTITSDLSLPGSAEKLYDQVTKEGLHVDVLVNNAGLGAAGDSLEQPIDLVERMTTLNCTKLAQLTQLFGGDMIKRGSGWMLQMSSPGQNLYHATKHYVPAFSEALCVKLRAYPGITNPQLMPPGPTNTQFVTRSNEEETVTTGASQSLEDPKSVAMAGYKGLCKRKKMIFSSWNDASMAAIMQLAPRSVHLTIASAMNAPGYGLG